MTPYLVIFFILSFFHFIEFFKNKANLKFIMIIISSLILIFFTGLRKVGVGIDDPNYYNMFMFIAPSLDEWMFGNYVYSINDIYMEPGYVFVNSIVKIFTDNYSLLFLTIAFLSVGITSYNYSKYSKYIFLSLLLFFVHTYLYRDMTQIRAGVAAAIGLFLISQIDKREHLKVFFTLLIASTFHIASFSLLTVYLLSFIKLTRKIVVLCFFLSVFFGLLGISQIILGIIPGSGFLAMKLYSYTANEGYLSAISLFDITNIKNSFILLLIVLFWDKLKKTIPYFKTVMLFYLLAVFIRIAFYDLGVLAARISTFFGIVEVIIIPYFIFLFRQKIVISFLIIFYAFLMLYLNLFIKIGRNPYESSIF